MELNAKIMKKYKYKAIATTPQAEHVHCDRVKEGETYIVSKTEDSEFVKVTGNLYNYNMGMDRVCDKSLHISRIKDYVILIGQA